MNTKEQPPMKHALTILMLAAACAVNAQLVPTNTPANVVLAWDASPSTEVTGYNVYWGSASGYYTNLVTTTNLTAIITNLQRGVTYYFAATAFTATGLESEFSNEVSYAPAARPVAPVLRLSMVHGWRVQGQGEPYQMYRLQRTTNLVAWVTVATATADRHGAFSACDPEPTALAAFYRTAL